MRLSISEYMNLLPISHRFPVTTHPSNHRLWQGLSVVNALVLRSLCEYRRKSYIL